jgi:hypothetical protein
MERIVPAGGLKFDHYHIPEGTVVGIPQYVVHRDRNIYGADAEDFRPERWLEVDDTSLKNMEQTFMTVIKVIIPLHKTVSDVLIVRERLSWMCGP